MLSLSTRNSFGAHFLLIVAVAVISMLFSDHTRALSFDPEFEFLSRVRVEDVKVDDVSERATTAKFRFGIRQSTSDNSNIFVELDHVQHLFDDDFNDGVTQTSRPAIVDPEGTELNQFFFKVSWRDLTAVLGRQKITFADERFLGNVGFRQNDQTYDAVFLETDLLSSSHFQFAYIHNVNRIFGDQADGELSQNDIRFGSLGGARPATQLGNHHIDGFFAQLEIRELDYVEFDFYAHDVHNYHTDLFSFRNLGGSVQFKRKYGDFTIKSAIELAAQQRDVGDSQWISYRKFSASLGYKRFSFGARHERFAERDNVAFVTPLATLHRFQGWADQFLATPSTGLSDNSLSFVWRKRPWMLDVRHHWFKALSSGSEIGQETDVDFIYKPNRNHQIKLRYADFRATAGQTIRSDDVRKIFLMYTIQYK